MTNLGNRLSESNLPEKDKHESNIDQNIENITDIILRLQNSQYRTK